MSSYLMLAIRGFCLVGGGFWFRFRSKLEPHLLPFSFPFHASSHHYYPYVSCTLSPLTLFFELPLCFLSSLFSWTTKPRFGLLRHSPQKRDNIVDFSIFFLGESFIVLFRLSHFYCSLCFRLLYLMLPLYIL